MSEAKSEIEQAVTEMMKRMSGESPLRIPEAVQQELDKMEKEED